MHSELWFCPVMYFVLCYFVLSRIVLLCPVLNCVTLCCYLYIGAKKKKKRSHIPGMFPYSANKADSDSSQFGM